MSTDIMTVNNSLTPAEVVMNGETSLRAIEQASIDMRIATAHQFPRSLTKFKERAIALATLDEETANSCIYRRPVGREPNGQMKYAEGMSVRMAEIVGSSFGNLQVRTFLVQQTERMVVVQGVAQDLETNFTSSSEVIESTVTKTGRPYDERMRIVIAKAAHAKARRDAIFQVVPKALAKPVETAVREMLMGNAEPLVKRRERALQWVRNLGINEERVWVALGVAGADDLTENHLFTLTGLRTSIKDGEVTIDEAFPELKKTSDEKPAPAQQTAIEKATSKLREKASKAKSSNAEPAQTPAPSPTPEEKNENAFNAKMDEIAAWVRDGCEVRDDYLSAIQMLTNFVNDGKLNPEWLEDAKAVVKKVASECGVKI
ncbi:MAG: hypothetical protein IJG38_01970 [Thermoguttaceae bacterium]|nr:hypothetical protein [Thermoguttaceae bacterium]